MAARDAPPAHAPPFIDPPGYARHRPEQTLLYQIIEQHYPAFREARAAQGRPLPRHVQEEFEAYLKCGRLEHGFLRLRCEACHAGKLVAFSCKRRGFCPSCGARRMVETAALLVDEVLPRKPLRQWVLSLPFALRFLLATDPKVLTQVLGIAYRTIAAHLIKKAGLTHATGATGAVTLIQRFGSALNANVHFHMLVLDGVYLTGEQPALFRPLDPPSAAELQILVQRIAERIGRTLERQGLLVRDWENSYLALAPEEGASMNDLLGHSITYRIAVGPRQGQKVFTLQTLPPADERLEDDRVARAAGFSLHAGVAARGAQRAKLEHVCRYVSRPALATERLALTPAGNVRYTLKTPYRDGTTHVVFEPWDFLARLAALVPLPRVHLTRYHGVFAPHSRWRSRIAPAGRGSASRDRSADRPAASKHRALTWSQRLKRVFHVDLERCARCGGRLKILACIEDPAVIGRILEHLQRLARLQPPTRAAPQPRAPPQLSLPV